MDSTVSDGHGQLRSSAAAPASAVFVDDHPIFLPSSSSSLLDDVQAGSFHQLLPSGSFPAATGEQGPAAGLTSPPSGRKPPRKRPRASRRPPTTVLTTDTSNFRAMVQEFTGFPAPPPFVLPAPAHLRPGGALFGAVAGPSDNPAAAAASPSSLLLHPSHLRLPAASRASPPDCTTSNTASSLVLDALASFDKTNAAAIPPPAAAAAAAAATTRSSSDFYGSWPFNDGRFQAADGEWAGPGHGLFSYRH